MRVLESFFDELEKDSRYYHSSPSSGLKEISPDYNKKRHKKGMSDKYVYVTDDPSYASAFGFEWSEEDGIGFGRVNKGPWTLEVPKKELPRLDNPMSLYKVEGNTKRADTNTPEWISKNPLKVVDEKKYNTVRSALKDYGVRIKVI